MPSFNRATLPEEFYERVSSQILVKPEPQYLYAQLWLGAMGMSLQAPAMLGLEGRAIASNGADYPSAERDRLMLASPLMNEVVAAKVDFTKEFGNTIKINRPTFTNSTYTVASRQIASGATISTTGIAVASEQTNLTLFRYGGPYSTTVQPYAIEAFDSKMSVHSAVKIHGTNLIRDCHRFLDAVNGALLDTAATTTYPAGVTADNDVTLAGTAPMTFEQIARTEEQMDTANLPTFSDGFRLLVLTPTQVRQLKNDPQYQRAAQMMPQYNILFPQYVSSVGKFHIFKSTTLSTANNSSSIPIHKGHAIAPGALLGGMGRPLRVMPNTNDNYGETVLVIWLGDLAFGLADNTFVVSVRSAA